MSKKSILNLFLNMPAKRLVIIALTIWLCSLALTGIDCYSTQFRLVGYQILAMGWLSPLVGNFAWFANIFFLYGISQLIAGRSAIKTSIIATILSFDTFRFDEYMMNEGGATTPVYGYGWGAILWFLSIFLLLAAAGKRQLEIRGESSQANEYEWLRPLGFLLFIVFLGTTIFLAVHDRIEANTSEIKRLEYLAFKRSKICHAPEPNVNEPIRNFSGALEVVMDQNTLHANFPFRQTKDLLSWGIPAVRFSGNDYSYNSNGEVTSIPATGAPTAILYVKESYVVGRISAKLVEVNTNRTVFDQVWEREQIPSPNYYCPDYQSFPSLKDQPRLLLMHALGLPIIEHKSTKETPPIKIAAPIESTLVEHTEGKVYQYYDKRPWRPTSLPFHERFNTNCPSDIGWDNSNLDPQQNIGWKFMVNGKAYNIRNRNDRYFAICEGDSVYIYSGYSGNTQQAKYYLNIEKRTLPDFKQVWSEIVSISGITSPIRDNVLEIQTLKEANDSMTIKLINDDSGEILLVRMPINHKPLHQ